MEIGPLIATVVVAALVGAAGGAGTRMLLGRLPRGAAVPPGRCEPLLAGLWAVTGWGWAVGVLPARLVPLVLGLGWLAVAAGTVDARHRRLPDALTLPAVPAALALLAPLGTGALVRGVAGAVLAVLAYGVLHLVAPESLGAGDVKLAGSLGAATAGVAGPAAALATAVAGLLTVVVALASRQSVVPHGPAMLVAAWALVAGFGVAGTALGTLGGG